MNNYMAIKQITWKKWRFLEKFNLPKMNQEETEIMKIRAQIRGKEMKETIVKINKLKAGSLRS